MPLITCRRDWLWPLRYTVTTFDHIYQTAKNQSLSEPNRTFVFFIECSCSCCHFTHFATNWALDCLLFLLVMGSRIRHWFYITFSKNISRCVHAIVYSNSLKKKKKNYLEFFSLGSFVSLFVYFGLNSIEHFQFKVHLMYYVSL